jgi:type III secretion protein Y
MTVLVEDAVQLLHAVGYVYGRQGQAKRAITLLLIAARLAPHDVGVLRTLAHAFLIDGSPRRAMVLVDQLRSMKGADHPALDLLACQALWASGREIDARRAFRNYVQRPRRA